MNDFVIGLLWGVGGSIILVPIIIWFYNLVIKTFERRKIKKMIARGEFLKAVDEKDYDTKAWSKDNPLPKKDEVINKLNDMFKPKNE